MFNLILKENLFFIKNIKDFIVYNKLFIENKIFYLPEEIKIDLTGVTKNIFVINLPKNVEYKKKIKNKFKKYNIKNYEFFDGVIPDEKQTILFQELRQDTDPLGRINYIGELGCFLAHNRLWENIKLRNLDNAIIFEDDIFFHKDFQRILEKNINVFKDFDIVFLGISQSIFTHKIKENIKKNTNLNKNYYLCNHMINEKKKIYSYGTFGYFVKKKTINLFLDNIDAPNFKFRTIDTFIQDIIDKKKLKSCIFYPNLVIADVSESTIREKREFMDFSFKKKWDLPCYDFLNYHN
jgi:GR25 family glycosyltransferase involved in LPS biosynthesis